MPRGDSWDDRRWPRRDRRSAANDIDIRERGYPYPRRIRSGAVTALAIISLVAGVVELIVGLCGLVVVRFTEGENLQAPGLPGIGGSALIGWLLLAVIFFWGMLAMAAGIGLLCRGNWARLLCLMLGAFAALVGLLYMLVVILLMSGFRVIKSDSQTPYLVGDSIAAFLFLGYAIYAYAVLLHPARAEEFR